ncbi:hypothetical protein F8M49_20885 [Rhodococcus zopfii]|uniref:Uncharacterized protein n=1 Tax=Rhodococcus zopfii TaxID=43772 RepID=A0ABU3WT60_9NOCA|nr:hypothetical protein [Rhodococcus zopfii]
MPWLRTGDNVATNPRLLRVYDDPDASTSLVIEAFGFLVLCASLAAAHTTDYVVSWAPPVSSPATKHHASSTSACAPD